MKHSARTPWRAMPLPLRTEPSPRDPRHCAGRMPWDPRRWVYPLVILALVVTTEDPRKDETSRSLTDHQWWPPGSYMIFGDLWKDRRHTWQADQNFMSPEQLMNAMGHTSLAHAEQDISKDPRLETMSSYVLMENDPPHCHLMPSWDHLDRGV